MFCFIAINNHAWRRSVTGTVFPVPAAVLCRCICCSDFQLYVVAADRNGRGNSATATLIITVLDVNDHTPSFTRTDYEFVLSKDLMNLTSPAVIKVRFKKSLPCLHLRLQQLATRIYPFMSSVAKKKLDKCMQCMSVGLWLWPQIIFLL